jgi:hypothetical protein
MFRDMGRVKKCALALWPRCDYCRGQRENSEREERQ